jgi:hypothetical protein
LLQHAAEWRLLGLLFERPRPAWRLEIDALAAEVTDPALRAAAAAVRNTTEGEYLSVLGPGGAVSPREVAYRPFQDPGWILAGLNYYYEAFAFHPRAEDPLDHLAVEIGFVAYLYLKGAYARAGGVREAAHAAAAAREWFLTEHLATPARSIAARLEAAGVGALSLAARCLAGRVPAVPASDACPDLDDLATACGRCAAGPEA